MLERAAKGFIVWLGEVVVGLLPLLTYELVITFATLPNGKKIGPPYAEVCILAVVISGLSLISLFPYGLHPRKNRFTAWTYFLGLLMFCLSILVSMLYSIVVVGSYNEVSPSIYYWLAAAILGSLGISLERALFDAETNE